MRAGTWAQMGPHRCRWAASPEAPVEPSSARFPTDFPVDPVCSQASPPGPSAGRGGSGVEGQEAPPVLEKLRTSLRGQPAPCKQEEGRRLYHVRGSGALPLRKM